jgi:hypothetical protein
MKNRTPIPFLFWLMMILLSVFFIAATPPGTWHYVIDGVILAVAWAIFLGP